MANVVTYQPIREGKELLFITSCRFCQCEIYVKRRNTKYCSKSCKELAYRKRKATKEETEKVKQEVTENKINTLNIQIRTLIQKGNPKDKPQIEMLQRNREKFLLSMDK